MFNVVEVPIWCPCCRRMFVSEFFMNDKNKLELESNSYRDPALPFSIHECPNEVCKFTAPFNCFNTAENGSNTLDERTQDYIRYRLPFAMLEKNPDHLSSRFYSAALIAAAANEPPSSIGDLYMRAAWSTLLNNDDASQEPFYRKWTAEFYERALAEPQRTAWQYRPLYAAVIAMQYSRLHDRQLFDYWQREMELSSAQALREQFLAALRKNIRWTPHEIPEETLIFELGETLCL